MLCRGDHASQLLLELLLYGLPIGGSGVGLGDQAIELLVGESADVAAWQILGKGRLCGTSLGIPSLDLGHLHPLQGKGLSRPKSRAMRGSGSGRL